MTPLAEPTPVTTKPNPLKLNALQLKTMTVLQQLARTPIFSSADEANGEVVVHGFPRAHGNHFHIGDAVVMAKDMTGLNNPNVWSALARKGLAKGNYPGSITLTAEGVGYQTGIEEKVLLRSDH